MKKIGNIWKVLLIIPVLVTSCQEETFVRTGPPVGDEINLVFSVVSGGGTRSLTPEQENEIDHIDVLVFKEGQFVERATGTIVTDNSTTKEFEVTLTTNNADNNYLVIIANARQAVNDAALYGMKDDVLPTIVFENKAPDGRWPANLDGATDNFTPIPMFGEYGPLAINKSLEEKLKHINIPLYRAMARIDVTDKAANFQLTSVHFYKYNTKGCVVPGSKADWQKYPYSSDPSNPEWRVTNVSIPPGTDAVESFLNYNVESNESVTSSIYVMEIDRAERNDYPNATCLVVGGRFGGSSAPVTYYRIDFEIIWRIKMGDWDDGEWASELIIEAGVGDELLGRTFARMLRNHTYDITITNATGPGAGSPEEALNNKKTEIEVKAAVWYNHTLNIELK